MFFGSQTCEKVAESFVKSRRKFADPQRHKFSSRDPSKVAWFCYLVALLATLGGSHIYKRQKQRACKTKKADTAMSDKEVLRVGNKPLSQLRVVDLKKELEKRHLSKTGNKTELVERLKAVCMQLLFQQYLNTTIFWQENNKAFCSLSCNCKQNVEAVTVVFLRGLV